MKLFEMKNYNLIVSEEAWGYIPFNKLLKRDKSKNKEIAFKELLFIWNYCDIKSDYIFINNKEVKISEIKKDIGLPIKWKIDKDVQAAINFYNKFITTIEQLYRNTLMASDAIGNYLSNTKALLAERDVSGKPVNDINKMVGAVQKVPKLMSDLKAAYKEVVKEQKETQGRTSGSKSHNLFEEGL